MKDKQRLLLGSLFFALMFFNIGVHAYFAFIYSPGSYAGWQSEQKESENRAYITYVDPNSPASALQAGDEILAINGITPAQDPKILSFARRVPPGTTFKMTLRRDGRELEIPVTTIKNPTRGLDRNDRFYVVVFMIFVVTGFIVFLLKHDNRQAWLLALMLGTFMGLFNMGMPWSVLGPWVYLFSLGKIICYWSLPLFVRFFLNFPDRSPILQRIPKLESYLNWPFYLFVLPYLGGGSLPDQIRNWYFGLSPIGWLAGHVWSRITLAILAAYLVAGPVCLLVNYRAADSNGRRRLRVVMLGSGLGVLTLLLKIVADTMLTGLHMPWLVKSIDIGLVIGLPLIPLSFAYAIIRHKVIPISLIVRRSARYVLVSRGSAVLVIAGVCVVMFFATDALFLYANPISGRTVGIVSGVLAIIVWNLAYSFHRRVIAPLIDRRFFRESYDARQILAELSQSVRSTTDSRQLLELVSTRIQKALHVENVTVFLHDEVSGDYAGAISLEYQSNANPAVASQNGMRLPTDAHVIKRLRESAEPLRAEFHDPDSPMHQPGLGNGNRSSHSEREILKRLNTALLLPLAGKDHLLGVISLAPRLGDQPFTREDEQMLMSVVGQTTFAMENIRLIERMIGEERRRQELEAENEQRARELEEARQLQLSMLPKHVPNLSGFEIAAYMKPATEVGGDYYDFHLADDGTLTVAVGDATGHGLKAGTMVTATKGLFEAFAQQPDLIHILQQTSNALKRMNLRSLFMAMTIIKIKGNQMAVSIAGMPPVLVYRAASGKVEEIAIRGLPLGSLANYSYKQQEMTIASGDVVALMSDGLPERFNSDQQMLDYTATKRAFADAAHQSPQAIIEHLVKTGELWAGGRPQDDDMTFVVLKFKD